MTKRDSRDKRSAGTQEKWLSVAKEVIDGLDIDIEEVIRNPNILPQELRGPVLDHIKRYNKSVETHAKKQAADELITLDKFTPIGDISREIKEICAEEIEYAECLYYGFGWNHPLCRHPMYDYSRSFDRFETDDLEVATVQCKVIEPPKQKMSKKKTPYYIVRLQDCCWKEISLTVWEEDYNRFKEEFEYWNGDIQKGHMMQIKVKKPSGGFGNYTFDSPPRYRRKEIPMDKSKDYRLIILS